MPKVPFTFYDVAAVDYAADYVAPDGVPPYENSGFRHRPNWRPAEEVVASDVCNWTAAEQTRSSYSNRSTVVLLAGVYPKKNYYVPEEVLPDVYPKRSCYVPAEEADS